MPSHVNIFTCGYFNGRLILYKLHIFLPHEDGFNKAKNDYEDSAYYSVCDEYGVDPVETWMYGEWLYTTDYAVFGHEVKATERSPLDNLTRWIIAQSQGFTKNGIEKISGSVMVYVYLVLSSRVKARSTVAGNSAPAVDVQKVFKDTFNDLIRRDLSIVTEKISRGARACTIKGRFFSRGWYIYAPKQFELKHWKKEGHINKTLVSNTHENWFKQGYKQGS